TVFACCRASCLLLRVPPSLQTASLCLPLHLQIDEFKIITGCNRAAALRVQNWPSSAEPNKKEIELLPSRLPESAAYNDQWMSSRFSLPKSRTKKKEYDCLPSRQLNVLHTKLVQVVKFLGPKQMRQSLTCKQKKRDQCCIKGCLNLAARKASVRSRSSFSVLTVRQDRKQKRSVLHQGLLNLPCRNWSLRSLSSFLVLTVRQTKQKENQMLHQGLVQNSAADNCQWEVVKFLVRRRFEQTKDDQCCIKGCQICLLDELSVESRHVSRADSREQQKEISAAFKAARIAGNQCVSGKSSSFVVRQSLTKLEEDQCCIEAYAETAADNYIIGKSLSFLC
uniref:ATP-dependent DNA helicase n=1 Tax=Macrostomum lignano TaxID=282301 RepID=A0A1I8F629_9PLAT